MPQDNDKPLEEFFAGWREADAASPTPPMEAFRPKQKPARHQRWYWASAATLLIGMALGVWWFAQPGPTEMELTEEEVLDTHGIMAWESPTDPLLEDF